MLPCPGPAAGLQECPGRASRSDKASFDEAPSVLRLA